MLRIGEFSRLAQVSADTLRYYDECGLLRPVHTDRASGYRYYAVGQLPRLNRILALKDLGFSLDQIAHVLDDGLPAAEIRGMLRLKRAAIQQVVASEQARLVRIEARLRHIEQEDIMPDYDIVIKAVEPMLVASARQVVALDKLDEPYSKVYTYLAEHGVPWSLPNLIVWHGGEYPDSVDAETAAPLTTALPGTARVHVSTLPGVEMMASVIHRGDYTSIAHAYIAIQTWVEENGYRLDGPTRQAHLQYADDADPATYVTDVQYPIVRA